MEQAIRSRIRPRHDQVNFIRYADDFVVTARTRQTLEQIVKPAKDGVKALLQKARVCIKGSLGQTAATLIRSLNPLLRLHPVAKTVIERHVNVRGEANPYDPNYTQYFQRRRSFAWRTLPLQKGWSTRPRQRIKGSRCSR